MKKMIFISICLYLILLVTFLPSAYAGKQLVICTYGGEWAEIMNKVFFKPFEKKTGIKVIQVFGPSMGKIRAMVQTGNIEWDMIEQGGGQTILLAKDGLLEKLDYSLIPKETLSGFEDYQMGPYGMWFMMYSIVQAYRTDAFPKDRPKSWADFWDVKRFPGPRSLKSAGAIGYGPFEEALLADGVTMDKLYPIDMKRAFKSLDKIKPHVAKWWTTGAQPAQFLIDREVVAASSYNGRIDAIKNQGAKVEIEWNQGKVDPEFFVIVKGTKNYKEAMQMIAFIAEAKNQAAMSMTYPNAAANKHAYKYISAERAKDLPGSPENYKKMYRFNNEWWASTDPVTGKSMVEVGNELWNKWILE